MRVIQWIRAPTSAQLQTLDLPQPPAECIAAIIAVWCKRKLKLNLRLEIRGLNSSEKRLARLLLLLANFGKEATVEPIVGKFSQETLAEMIGTTRSRVSFFMNKFRKLGYIEYN